MTMAMVVMRWLVVCQQRTVGVEALRIYDEEKRQTLGVAVEQGNKTTWQGHECQHVAAASPLSVDNKRPLKQATDTAHT